MLVVILAAACGESTAETSLATSPLDHETSAPEVTATDSAGNRYDADGNVIGRENVFGDCSQAPDDQMTVTTHSHEEIDGGLLLTRIVFVDAPPELIDGGPTGFVEVTNTGPGVVSLDGYFLVLWAHTSAVRFGFPDLALEEDEKVRVFSDGDATGSGGDPVDEEFVASFSWEGRPPISKEQGNVALYVGDMEGRLNDDPEAVVDYVQWGPPGAAETAGTCIAVAAGVWDQDVELDPSETEDAISLDRQGRWSDGWTVIP